MLHVTISQNNTFYWPRNNLWPFFPFFSLKENKICASLSGIKQTAHINKDISYVFLASYESQFWPTGNLCTVNIAVCVS